MDASLLWLLVGLGLIVAEVATGTFYLLFLGVAALAGSAVAYFGYPLFLQSLIAAIVAMAGVLWAQYHNRKQALSPMPSIDLNQAVIWEEWIDRSAALGRVKYRGASWEAQVQDAADSAPGDTLYIVAVEGSSLRVAKSRTAS